MEKYCSQCGAQNLSDAKYCIKCGKPFDSTHVQNNQQQSVHAKTSGMAIASLVLSLLWIFGIGSILAIIFGHIARSQIARSGGRLKGAGIALAGLIIGYIMIAIVFLGILAGIALPKFVAVSNDAKIAKVKAQIADVRRAVSKQYAATGHFVPSEELSVNALFDGVGLHVESAFDNGHWRQDSSDSSLYYFRINGKDCAFYYNENDGSFTLQSSQKVCQQLAPSVE